MYMPRPLRFYETIWGILILALAGILILLAIFFAVSFFSYWRKINLEGSAGQFQQSMTLGRFNLPQKPNEKLAFSVQDDPLFGSEDAPLRIIEFGDFQCEHSRSFSFSLREMMIKHPERFQIIFRDFPLGEIHPQAFRAAEAANCAADQGKFWQMHDKLFQNQERLEELDLRLYALQIGLDMARFNQCFDGRKYKEEIEIDLADGQAAGVRGTPTFFVNGVKIEGAIPKDMLEKIITSR